MHNELAYVEIVLAYRTMEVLFCLYFRIKTWSPTLSGAIATAVALVFLYFVFDFTRTYLIFSL